MYNNLKIGYNIYEVLYIEEVNEKKRKIVCDYNYKDFRHKSYNTEVIFNHNTTNKKIFSELEKDINKILSNIRTYDKNPIPIDIKNNLKNIKISTL